MAGPLRGEHDSAGGRLAVVGNASEPEVPLASAVFAADTLAAAQTAAQEAQRRAELVPILGGDCDLPHDLVRYKRLLRTAPTARPHAGVLAGMLAAVFLLVLGIVVVKWLKVRTRTNQVPCRPCVMHLLPAAMAEV